MKPKDQTLTWTFRVGEAHYDALAVCTAVLDELRPILAEIREKLGLPPDKGLKRISMQLLKEMPRMEG
jgi:hypothetical protein